jgi:NitT/TauT family transport system ATP-binding protein
MYPFMFTEWKRRVNEKEAAKRVDEMLAEVGLADKKDLFPSQLSGGQNQRVALARALVLRPKVLLMDEPFGALDAQTRSHMQVLLAKLHEVHSCLVVFVTHDVTEALLLGDRVIVLSTQPARVIDDFRIEVRQPRSAQWLDGVEVRALHERVVGHLRAAGAHGNVRVSV